MPDAAVAQPPRRRSHDRGAKRAWRALLRTDRAGWAPLATRAIAVTALIGAGVAGVPVLLDQWTADRVEAAATQLLGGPSPMPWEAGGDQADCGPTCPARAQAAIGVGLTALAVSEDDAGRRAQLLSRAQARLDAALAVRPTAGDWWVWLAYARALDNQSDTQVIDGLARSYASAPYLADQGEWRVRYGAAHWSELSPAVRRAVVAEAVWIRDIDPMGGKVVFAAFLDPGARAALAAGLKQPPARLIPHRRSGGPGGVGAAG